MTQGKSSSIWLNDPDYELNRALLARIANLEQRLQVVERQEQGKVITTLSNAITASSTITAAGDVYAYGDPLGLQRRFINRYGNANVTDHFRSGSIPSGFTWQAGTFATPSSIQYSFQGEYLAVADGTSLGFLAKTGVTTYLNKRILMRTIVSQNTSLGMRFDDGTDNNYYQAYLVYSSSGQGTLKMQQRTGGGAVTTTSVVTVFLNELLTLMLYCVSGGIGHTPYFYIVNETSDVANLTSGTNVAWAVSRVGIVLNADSASKGGYGFCDWFYHNFT